MKRATDFWNRVELSIKDRYSSITEFCRKNEINVKTVFTDKAKDRFPRTDILIRIADALDASIDYLVFGSDKHTNIDDKFKVLERYNAQTREVRMAINKLLNIEVVEND